MLSSFNNNMILEGAKSQKNAILKLYAKTPVITVILNETWATDQ